MKTIARRLLCKIGLHKYSKWKINPYQALSAYDDNEYSYRKECRYCGVVKFKDFDRQGNAV